MYAGVFNVIAYFILRISTRLPLKILLLTNVGFELHFNIFFTSNEFDIYSLSNIFHRFTKYTIIHKFEEIFLQ